MGTNVNHVIHVSELSKTMRTIVRDVVAEFKGENESLVMTTEEVAKTCRVHPNTVRVWAKSGLRCIQMKPLRFLRSDVVEYLKGLRG